MSSARPRRPRTAPAGLLAAAAHDLRSSLGGIGGWIAVLESRLGDSPDPAVVRALEGIQIAVDQQVRAIEKLERGTAEDQAASRYP